jgi:hypothetical protein
MARSMMRSRLVLVALTAACTGGSAAAETYCTFFPAHPARFEIAGPFAMGMGAPRITGPASARMRGYVRDIARVLGVAEVPIFQGSVPNAAATPHGILYDARFMKSLERRAGRMGVISVLAHELGHKVNRDDSFFSGLAHPWDKELRADHISGYVLARLGASLSAATAALRSLYQPFGGPSHPGTPMRIPAVEAGWRQARAEMGTAVARAGDLGVQDPAPEAPLRPAERPRWRTRLVRVPCTHAAHPWDVVAQRVPTPFGWQEVHEAVPCRHAAHLGHVRRVPAGDAPDVLAEIAAPL